MRFFGDGFPAIYHSRFDGGPEGEDGFYRGKIAYYEDLLGRNVPGGAWFRHQIRLARAELNLPPGAKQGRPPAWQPGRTDDLADTYDLFTGGRAMSENLQLDRACPRPAPMKRR